MKYQYDLKIANLNFGYLYESLHMSYQRSKLFSCSMAEMQIGKTWKKIFHFAYNFFLKCQIKKLRGGGTHNVIPKYTNIMSKQVDDYSKKNFIEN